jgi:hypothetical protein
MQEGDTMTRIRGFNNPLAGIIGGSIVVILGIGMALFGWNIRAHTLAFVENSSRATGKVVDVVAQRKVKNGRQETLFYAVIEFTTVSGERIRYRDGTGSNPPLHREGDTVQVLYDPKNPSNASEESFVHLRLPVILVTGIGAFFIVLGLLWLIGTTGGLVGIGMWLAARKKTTPEGRCEGQAESETSRADEGKRH